MPATKTKKGTTSTKTHYVSWTQVDGYKFHVTADFVTANNLYNCLRKSPLVREVACGSVTKGN